MDENFIHLILFILSIKKKEKQISKAITEGIMASLELDFVNIRFEVGIELEAAADTVANIAITAFKASLAVEPSEATSFVTTLVNKLVMQVEELLVIELFGRLSAIITSFSFFEHVYIQ